MSKTTYYRHKQEHSETTSRPSNDADVSYMYQSLQCDVTGPNQELMDVDDYETDIVQENPLTPHTDDFCKNIRFERLSCTSRY